MMGIRCFRVSMFIMAALVIIPQGVNCLSCYNCTSEKSWADCNSRVTKTECPSTSANCVKNNLTCYYFGDAKSTYFYKGCDAYAEGRECEMAKKDTPPCPSSVGWTTSTDDYCCNENNCNSAGSSNKLSSALAGVFIVLVLWGLHTFVY